MKVHGGGMAEKNRLYSVEEGAYMTRLTMSSFRTRLIKLGIKGQKDGAKTYFTRAQLQDLYDGKASKMLKALLPRRAKAKKANARRFARKEKRAG
jgi:hypothetical protein